MRLIAALAALLWAATAQAWMGPILLGSPTTVQAGGGGTLVSDTFDGTANPLGGVWATYSGWSAMQKSGGAAYGTNGGGSNAAYWNDGTFADDQYCTVTLGTAEYAGCLVRVTASGSYQVYVRTSNSRIYVYRHTVSGDALLGMVSGGAAYFTQAVTTNDVLTLEVSGSETVTLVVKLNGTPVGTLDTDASAGRWTSGRPGVWTFGTSATILDFEGGDL